MIGPVEVLPTLADPVEMLPILVGPVEVLPILVGPVEVLPILAGRFRRFLDVGRFLDVRVLDKVDRSQKRINSKTRVWRDPPAIQNHQ